MDPQKEYTAFRKGRELPDNRETREAFKIACAFYRISELVKNPEAPLDEYCLMARRFPSFARGYIEAYQSMADATLSTRDLSGRIELFRQVICRLNQDLPLLERGMGYLEKGMGSAYFKTASDLYALKNDPRATGLSPDEFWTFISQNYPGLTDPSFYHHDPQKLLRERAPAQNVSYADLIGCFKEQEALAAKKHLQDFLHVQNVIENPHDDLASTDPYRRLFEIGLTQTQIDALLDAAEKALPHRSPNPAERKKEALVLVAANLSSLAEDFAYFQDTVRRYSDRELHLAIRCFNNPKTKFDSFEEESTAERTFIQIGHRMTAAFDSRMTRRFWFDALLNKNQQQVLLHRDEWILRSSVLFEGVLADTIANKDPRHPMDVHREIHAMATTGRTSMQALDGMVAVTDQFESDGHRYDQIILSPEGVQPVTFPGSYPSTIEARPHLLSNLYEMAGGDVDLACLLQEMVCQNAQKMAMAQWLYPDLETRLEAPKIYGFIMLIPNFLSTTVARIGKDRFHIDYKAEIRTNNQYMMEHDPENCAKRYTVHIRYEILQDERGRWIVQQPLWNPGEAEVQATRVPPRPGSSNSFSVKSEIYPPSPPIF